MAKASESDQSLPVEAAAGSGDSYVVVARRYRPQNFEQLVGQHQVAQALGNAIETHRVGHAYLFTGARGVGKTSTARIFSKCLNCVEGPTAHPCDRCDACESISSGEDVDVLEIDGASNRGIDEIRQLRSYASVRPTRSRFKIYIIDEVHMLTKEAFNALLKTLEEPPSHVKFIFCTTNPEKIPITVLSRCQRFDFAPVVADEIKERLRFIVDKEGAQAEDEALTLLARRAGGSMRDSQSLLEQLLSFSSSKITVASVHQMLGTAPGGRVETLVKAIAESNAGLALEEIHTAVTEGADVGQVLEQLTSYFRDLMVLSVGSSPDTLLQLGPDEVAEGKRWADGMGTTRLLATLQVFDWALARMRQSTQIRCLLEIAVVQACQLANLMPLSTAIETVGRLAGGAPPPPTARPQSPPPASGAGPGEKKNVAIANSPESAESPADQNHPLAPAAADAAGSDSNSRGNTGRKPETPAETSPPISQAASTSVAATPTNALEGTTDAELVTGPATTAHSSGQTAALAIASDDQPTPGHDDAKALVADGPNPHGTAEDAPGPATDPRDQQSAEPNASPSANSSRAAGSPWAVYRAAFESIDGMIRDLATSCTEVQELSAEHWRVMMENQYVADLCKRADRKQQIEDTVQAAVGRRIRIDFAFPANSADPHHNGTTRHTTKAQALRDLQEQPFVAKLNEFFQTEWVDILPPRKSKPDSNANPNAASSP